MSEPQLTADFGAVLDANVLANFALCDLLLRLAETPRLYIPFFSNEILIETRRSSCHPGHTPTPPGRRRRSTRLFSSGHRSWCCASIAPRRKCGDGPLRKRTAFGQLLLKQLVDVALTNAMGRSRWGTHDQIAIAVGLDFFEHVVEAWIVNEPFPHPAVQGVLLGKGSMESRCAHAAMCLKQKRYLIPMSCTSAPRYERACGKRKW